jgi:hypothetical protein
MKKLIAIVSLALGLVFVGSAAPVQAAGLCPSYGWVDANVCAGHPISPAETGCAALYQSDATVYQRPPCSRFAQYLVRASDGNGSAGGNGHIPATCDYQRYWTASACTLNGKTYPWTYSNAQGCQQEKTSNPAFYAKDSFCHRVTKPKHHRVYVVKRHQTLWRIAVIEYGSRFTYHEKAGHLWVVIAKANHIHGTRIHPGQVLLIP